MLAAAIGAGGLIAVLVSGLVLSVADLTQAGDGTRPPQVHAVALTPTPSPQATGLAAVSAQVARARDRLAARPMPDTGTGNAYGRPDLSTRDPGAPIILPPPARVGAWGVQTGYPKTASGALAQLAAIDVAALRSASLAGVRAVIREWAAPGGPSTETWSGVKAMASLLESTGAVSDGTARLSIEVIPRMGLIKGTVGNDFVVACVDFTIDITFSGTSRTVAADCQRMLWDGGRWLIGPGREPAKAPSVWPDTDAAIDAGYRDLLLAATSANGPESADGVW